MKVSINKKKLEKCISIALKAISEKTPFPILSHFRFEASQEKIKVSATDLEVGIEVSEEAEVSEEGSFAVPAKLFNNIIISINNELIELYKDELGSELLIKSGDYECSLMTLHSEEFPVIPRSDEESIFSIIQKDLKEAVTHVQFSAASLEETRAVLTGILIIINKSEASFVATDGKRLSNIKVPVEYNESEELKFILPKKILSEISGFLKKTDDPVYIGVKNSQMFFKTGDIFVISRLLEGNYPNFAQVIPDYLKYKILISRLQFLSSMKFILTLSKEKDFPNLIKMEISSGKILLRSSTRDMGNAFKEISCDYEGEYMEIAFNGQYFVDALDVISENEIYFEFNDSHSPGIIRPVFEKYSYNYISVIMPILTKN